MSGMEDHVAMLRKEIRKLQISLEHAKIRHGVTSQEIDNLNRNIRLKTELLNTITEDEDQTFAVFYKVHSSVYEPEPDWSQFHCWVKSLDEAIELLEKAKLNPRFEDVKIVIRFMSYRDYEEVRDINENI